MSGRTWRRNVFQGDSVQRRWIHTSRRLLDVAQPLLDQRTAQGLLTWAVPIDTVFEEFGFGEPRPEAIKDFLSYAYHHWDCGQLRATWCC